MAQDFEPAFAGLSRRILTARHPAQSEHWDEAISRYGAAIELDPELSDAYSGRGHALLQTKKLAKAHKDFAKAVELDPYSAEGVSGLGICLVMEGKIESGTKTIEDSRSKLNDDFVFTYNAACVYGRALEQTNKLPTTPERDKKADEFRKKALADLQLSVKLGFPDLDWMKKDSDLDSLHGLPDFKRIVSPDEKHSTEENPADDTNGDPKAPAKRRGDNCQDRPCGGTRRQSLRRQGIARTIGKRICLRRPNYKRPRPERPTSENRGGRDDR